MQSPISMNHTKPIHTLYRIAISSQLALLDSYPTQKDTEQIRNASAPNLR